MAFIHHHKINEVGRILAEPGGGFAVHNRTGHQGLEDGEEHAGVGGHAALFTQGFWIDSSQGGFFKGGKAAEVVEGLIGEGVAIGQEEDAGPAGGLAGDIPTGLEQLPDYLEGDRCLAGTGGHGQQDAVVAGGDRLQGTRHGDVLVEADLPTATLVGIGDGGEVITPGVFFGKAAVP